MPCLFLNLQNVQSPFLGNPPIYWFFLTPTLSPLQIQFFSEPHTVEPRFYEHGF